MSSEKSIVEVRKSNFFTKIINFFKKISFKNKKEMNKEDLIFNNSIEIEKNKQNEFENILSNQNKYRSGEVSLDEFSYEQIIDMINLYKVQINNVNKQIEEKLRKIEYYNLRLGIKDNIK